LHDIYSGGRGKKEGEIKGVGRHKEGGFWKDRKSESGKGRARKSTNESGKKLMGLKKLHQKGTLKKRGPEDLVQAALK